MKCLQYNEVSGICASAVAWHHKKISRIWLGPLKFNRMMALFALLLVVTTTWMNVQVRLNQSNIWATAKSFSEIEGSPTFSTAAAPHFLAAASALKSSHSFTEYFELRLYPNNIPSSGDPQPSVKSKNGLLLAEVIALFSPSSSRKDLLKTAHLIGFFSAGLTITMVAFAFGAAGYWLEGIIAALGGSLSAAFLVRSSFGRIDTDQLNLGFMYLMFGLVLMAGRSKSTYSCIAWTTLAGATANLFLWWYGKSELIWMAFCALAWMLIIIKRPLLLTIACLATYLIIASPDLVHPSDSVYVKEKLQTGNFIFPNTHATISEVIPISIDQILLNLSGSIEMALVGIIGLLMCAVRHPVIAVAYAPLAGFALLNYIIGGRAVFYSAPMIWFGATFLMTTSTRYIYTAVIQSRSKETRHRQIYPSLIGISLMLVITWINSPTKYYPRPTFPIEVQEGLIALDDLKDNNQSIVATWWDYGYASMFFNGLPTLHDGGSQTTPITHFFAKAILASNQSDMINILRFLSTTKFTELQEFRTASQLTNAMTQPVHSSSPDIYLILTSQMADWIPAISAIGNWDIKKGQPTFLSGEKNSSALQYIRMICNYSNFPQDMRCGDINVNLESGKSNRLPALETWSFAVDGFIRRFNTFSKNDIFSMQTLSIEKRLQTQLMRTELYSSSFNQLYHLGQIDDPEIELVYDNYPHVRIFKISKGP